VIFQMTTIFDIEKKLGTCMSASWLSVGGSVFDTVAWCTAFISRSPKNF